MPVLFGPNYHKFKEAVDLIHLGGAFTIDSYNSFKDRMRFLLGDPYVMKIASEVSRSFVAQSKGATEKILSYLNKAS
jgi:3-deoxy-D-manno-octulosonic-acid transferase